MKTKPITCKWCAGVDEEGIPINCLICRTNPKFIDQRKEYLEKKGIKE